jgi:hypothetical protein
MSQTLDEMAVDLEEKLRSIKDDRVGFVGSYQRLLREISAEKNARIKQINISTKRRLYRLFGKLMRKDAGIPKQPVAATLIKLYRNSLSAEDLLSLINEDGERILSTLLACLVHGKRDVRDSASQVINILHLIYNL